MYLIIFQFRMKNKLLSVDDVTNYDLQSREKEEYRSLEEKRKSVGEKLNAVLEKRLSMDSGKRISDGSMETFKPTSTVASTLLKEKKNVKANSTEDIKTQFGLTKTENAAVKSRSVGSSRNDSLESFSDELHVKVDDNRTEHDRKDATSDEKSLDKQDSGINVSVITSTPLKSRSSSRRSSGDNIVVITGKNLNK